MISSRKIVLPAGFLKWMVVPAKSSSYCLLALRIGVVNWNEHTCVNDGMYTCNAATFSPLPPETWRITLIVKCGLGSRSFLWRKVLQKQKDQRKYVTWLFKEKDSPNENIYTLPPPISHHVRNPTQSLQNPFPVRNGTLHLLSRPHNERFERFGMGDGLVFER